MEAIKRHCLNLVISVLVGCGFLAFAPCQGARAQQSSSTNYSVNEVFFGSGGELDAASTQYKSKQSAGEMGVGNVKSTSYQAQAGFNTDRDPFIAIEINTASVDLGIGDTALTRTGQAQFTTRAYLAQGYVVRSYGGPPSYSGHTLNTSSTPFSSSIGTEQFGFNVVANTSPSVGANPAQSPDYPTDPFGFGQAASGYDTANMFKYADGDVIAYSSQSSSDTIYTISYIFNISNITPSGLYRMDHVLVATATY